MDIQDKILTAVLENRSEIKNLKREVTEIKESQRLVIDRMDDFLSLASKNEAEITATQSRCGRIEERVEVLESHRV